ncbi:MAG: hypothetical protein JOY93_03205 [Acidobacteriales bacterium]|nr:hypothetical protein [Terriglobales bacterium]
MTLQVSRYLLGTAALLSALGAAIHAGAFKKAASAIEASDLPRFYASSSKALWLADSATLLILAFIFGVIAARPSLASAGLLFLLALVPAATAILIYTFVGNFPAAHLLLTIAVLVFLAALKFKGAA